MKKLSKPFLFAYAGIFCISFILRLSLALVNRDFNDNHIYVARLIMLTHKLPTQDDAWEAYQPKLYHYIVAMFAERLNVSPWNKNGLILTGQFINFFAGLIILFIALTLIRTLPLANERLKLIAFGLAALNPGLIAINSQATNDTFVILFSTLSIFGCYLIVNKYNRSILLLILILIFTSLAVASKANGWVAVIAIFLTFLIKGFFDKVNRLWALSFGIIFALMMPLISVVNPLTQYLYNYRHYGSPILSNMDLPSPPPLFGSAPFSELGVELIQDGFFTFKFIEILEHPVIDINRPTTASSFWTSFYGRAYSLHFDYWPPTWRNRSEYVLNLTRAIFVLALVPTFLLLFGFIVECIKLIWSLLQQKIADIENLNYGLFLLTFVGYIAFVMFYTYVYRTNAVMKPIFALPGLLSIVVLFLRGTDLLYVKWHFQKWILAAFEFAMVILLLLFITDVAILIIQLAHIRSPFS